MKNNGISNTVFKTIICIVISATVIAGMIPTKAYAISDITVCGEDAVGWNEHQLTGNNSGKVTYNNTDKILTLDTVKIPSYGDGNVISIGAIPIDIHLKGTSNITGTQKYATGLFSNDSIRISGDGSLGVVTTNDNSFAISSTGGLTIESGTLTATTPGFCIAIGQDADISGGSMTAIGGGYGILSMAGNVNITGGSLKAEGTASNGFGISAIGEGHIIITGGSVIAKGGSGAFEQEPIITGTWYKWRKSDSGPYIDSQVTPYSWTDTDTYVEIISKDAKTSTSDKSSNIISDGVCDHEYEWVEDETATPDMDAKLVYKCKKCGHIDMRMNEANSAYFTFNRDIEKKIKNAAIGATVKIDTTMWNSFNHCVIDALVKRNDVTLIIEYTDAGVRRQITIPAGTDFTGFIDENGYTGFKYLISKGLETNYWTSRLAKK